MTIDLKKLIADEVVRRKEFPVAMKEVFLAHAAVSPLPRRSADALREFAEEASGAHQESGSIPRMIEDTRQTAADLLGCRAGEIALLGPTSLGLSLVANGLSWNRGDEIVYYGDDYPANVYPWIRLRKQGVKAVSLEPACPGEITPELVEAALTPRTRLVALATAHFLSGRRPDIEKIGKSLRRRGVLFAVDGIQTLGAFSLSVENVDFLSADSHKWLLGPLGAGIVYVSEKRFAELEPTLVGSWNVRSPDFIAQDEISYYDGARRYEPGALNAPGILAMRASMKLLLEAGIENIGRRILELRRQIVDGTRALGFRPYPDCGGSVEPSGIVSLSHPALEMKDVVKGLAEKQIVVSLRKDRGGNALLRVSPHFYNTREEIGRFISALAEAVEDG